MHADAGLILRWGEDGGAGPLALSTCLRHGPARLSVQYNITWSMADMTDATIPSPTDDTVSGTADDRHIVGLRKTWLTLAQADSLKTYLSRVQSYTLRSSVESDDQAHLVYEALMMIRQSLAIALSSMELRQSTRHKKRQLEGDDI